MKYIERTLVLLAVWQMPQFAPPKSTQPRLPCSPKPTSVACRTAHDANHR